MLCVSDRTILWCASMLCSDGYILLLSCTARCWISWDYVDVMTSFCIHHFFALHVCHFIRNARTWTNLVLIEKHICGKCNSLHVRALLVEIMIVLRLPAPACRLLMCRLRPRSTWPLASASYVVPSQWQAALCNALPFIAISFACSQWFDTPR